MKPFKFFQKKSDKFELPLGYELLGLTPHMYDPVTFEPIRMVLYRDTITGVIIKGEQINMSHELWDYNLDV